MVGLWFKGLEANVAEICASFSGKKRNDIEKKKKETEIWVALNNIKSGVKVLILGVYASINNRNFQVI